VKAAFIHVIGDLIQSIGVVIASAFIWCVGGAAVQTRACVVRTIRGAVYPVRVAGTTRRTRWQTPSARSSFRCLCCTPPSASSRACVAAAFCESRLCALPAAVWCCHSHSDVCVFVSRGQAARTLLNSVPDSVHFDDIFEELQAMPGVTNVHDLHIWSISSSTVRCCCVRVAARVHPMTRALADGTRRCHCPCTFCPTPTQARCWRRHKLSARRTTSTTRRFRCVVSRCVASCRVLSCPVASCCVLSYYYGLHHLRCVRWCSRMTLAVSARTG
jgi:hypothetical protein